MNETKSVAPVKQMLLDIMVILNNVIFVRVCVIAVEKLVLAK